MRAPPIERVAGLAGLVGLAVVGFGAGMRRPSAEARVAKLRAACVAPASGEARRATADRASCERLGDELERGHATPRFADEAGLAFAEACEAGLATACVRAQPWSKPYGDYEVFELDVGCMLHDDAFACEEVAESLARDDDAVASSTTDPTRLETAAADRARRVVSRSRRALDLHLADCAKGRAESCLGAGRVYSAGIGVDWNPREARALTGRACDLGLAAACEQLGDATSGDDAIAAYLRACDRDGPSPHACTKLARAHEARPSSSDAVTAAYRRACALLDLDACGWIAARITKLDGEPPDVVRSFARWCKDGDPRACALSKTTGSPDGKLTSR